MLQKILVVLLGFAMSLVGALAPSGLFAANSLEGEVSLSAQTTTEVTATVDAFGKAFVRVPALWIEVDGRRVTEDAWGTGDIKELKFKVGVRDVEDKSLAIGDRRVPLKPTDVITIRMFRGDFAYRDVGVAGATIQLQGEVKTTLVKSGEASTKVRTQLGDVVDATSASRAGDDNRIAYVVLETGAKLDTVEVAAGGRRVITEEASTSASASGTPGNLLARWVKLDGKPVRDYTWGNGPLGRIEFQPADAASSIVVAFDGRPAEVLAGQTVRVRDFVGEYTAYQVAGGNMRLRLDGYAADTSVISDILEMLPPGGSEVPHAAFEYFPPNPRTTDTVQFYDRSVDEDGVIAFQVWDFGDGNSGTLAEPTHRFTTPGIYAVTLRVTDEDLHTSQVTRNLTIRNAVPVPDFDFSPKIVTSDTVVTFADRSVDTDGTVTAWSWNFGNGATSTARNPQHRFTIPGNATVTLTATDNSGEISSISKILIVRNAPPTAAFTYSPINPLSQVPVQFFDNSTDRDGTVVDWRWDFGDGTTGSGANPTHAYATPKTYTVQLTAIDDKGDRNTASNSVTVRNRPANVDFVFTPAVPLARQTITFQSLANDPDGQILHHEWTFQGVSTPSTGPTATAAFPSSGVYWVNLSVIDSAAERSWINKTVTVNNSAPTVRIGSTPNPALRDVDVFFTDLSTDPDGDAIVAWDWSFGDGSPNETIRNPLHRYTTLGNYTVGLKVTDSAGRSSEAQVPMRVVNSRPLIGSLTIAPRATTVGAPVYFNATAIDVDLRAGQVLTYTWTFSDGQTLTGSNVVRSFSANGEYQATVVVVDPDGEASVPRVDRVVIDFPLPVASFAIAPTIPTVGVPAQFTDTSTSTNGNITAWRWEFGDGVVNFNRTAAHSYAQSGQRTVQLTVTDSVGKAQTVARIIRVNAPPVASFDMDRSGTLPRGTVVTFNDTSRDPENAIVAWRWSYGDGVFENYTSQTNPTHAFATPGTHVVTLEVEDDAGARSNFARIVSIQNQRPVARFSYTPSAPFVGDPVQFTSLSSDPDGTPIVSWLWNLGDGTTSTSANPTHSFARSGRYLVTLKVSDGQLDSLSDAESVHFVDVGANHDLAVRMRAILPDGRPVDLSGPNIVATVAVVRASSTTTMPITITSAEITANLLAGQWRSVDRVQLSIRNTTFMSTPLVAEFRPDDQSTLIDHEFTLPMPLVPNIVAEPGDSTILALGSARTARGTPVYRDPWEGFHGYGYVNWTDGWAATSARVTVEVRYVPLSLLNNFLSGDNALLEDLMGWCQVATSQVQANGRYDWAFEPRIAGCVTDGVFLPGLYQVRAVATHTAPGVGQWRSAPANIIVDPTGLVVEAIESRTS